jgi:predicted metalloprotease with PDZ domain
MRGNTFPISICIGILTGMLCAGALPALAQNEPGIGIVILDEGKADSDNGSYAYMGVNLGELTARARDRAEYPHKTGVIISGVAEGSPADEAGLQENDIVYLFNGSKVENAAQIVSLVRSQKPGDQVSLVIYRDGKEKKITVTLGSRKMPSITAEDLGKYSDALSLALGSIVKSGANLYTHPHFLRGWLGMVLTDLNEDLAPYFNAKADGGALVLDVEAQSPAAKAGIKGGDVLVSVDGTAVSDASDVIDALAELETGDTASLEVTRRGAKKTFEIEIEAGSELRQLFVAPFELSKIKRESLDRYRLDKSGEEAAALRREMKALKERLKEMEDRLNEVEKNR